MITQKELETNAALQSILLDKGKLKPSYSKITQGLTYPKKLLTPETEKLPEDTILPEIVYTEPPFTEHNHAVSRGLHGNWNYYTLARDIAKLNDIPLPSHKQVYDLLKAKALKPNQFSQTKVQSAGTVSSHSLEEVMTILFGKPDPTWAEVFSATIGYVESSPETNSTKIPVEKPILGMNLLYGDSNFDKFQVAKYNALLNNSPSSKPPKTISAIKEMSTKWFHEKSPSQLYNTLLERVKAHTSHGIDSSISPKLYAAFLQAYRSDGEDFVAIVQRPSSLAYADNIRSKIHPIYDEPNPKELEVIERFILSDKHPNFYCNDQLDYYLVMLYFSNIYNKIFDIRSIHRRIKSRA